MTITRRNFLAQSSALTLGAAAPVLARNKKTPRILLRSSWQVFNIGDIAHAPGVLTVDLPSQRTKAEKPKVKETKPGIQSVRLNSSPA